MVCNCLELRRDSKLAKIMSNKCISILVAIIQLLIMATALFTFITHPGSVEVTDHNATVGTIAFIVFIALVCIAFSVLLLIGLLKDKLCYIRAYLIFIIVLIVLLILSIFFNLFTQPRQYGFSGFFSAIFSILVDFLTYFVIKNYYLALTAKTRNQNNGQNRV